MLEQIITALLGGVMASSSKVASEAVEDTYRMLKTALVSKLGEKARAVEAVAKLEANPESAERRVAVEEEMVEANVAADPSIVDAARQLQNALEQLPAKDSAHVQQAVGHYIAQASAKSTAAVKVSR